MTNALKQYTLTLPEDLHRRLKIAAAQQGNTMAEIIASAVEVAVTEWEDQVGGRVQP